MTKLIQLTFFLLFCLQTPLKAQIPTEKAILWEVSGKDLPKSSYLFGTFHLLCPDDLQVSSTIKEKFDSSKQLYLEIDFSDPNIGMKMMQMMQMRNDSTFHDLYDSLTYAQINDTLEKHTHMGLDMFNKIKPFGLYSVVMMSALGCQPASWELTLVKMAKEKGWKMNGLETLESQAAIFDTVPYLLQAEQLKEMAFNMDSTKQEINKLIKLYKEQDINTMHEKITSDPLTENYLDIMLYNRNANWISTIIKQAQTTSTFFAFGAGHLGGEKGVINLLRRRGYTVRPINPLDDKSN
ncbi:TraB/GumN family protein [Olivibacter domesticus]|uniref:TraB family protein n=1 Tax=Olivibacter domesticus TaxID=407022 RepID=A0A1H7VUY7_OLID1|nr:TraB/GumN family protein [Olivibacter domesticus]SEM12635.1 hypothetical protein SAMN05661044_04347 [Olivibacter domesticus]